MKRLRDQEASRFAEQAVLHHRYALMGLLGKGGFSEVWLVSVATARCFCMHPSYLHEAASQSHV